MISTTLQPVLVLASASARRSAILKALGVVDFAIRPIDAPEPRTSDPVESCILAATSKHSAARSLPANASAAILAADTLVSAGGRPIGKPKDRADALDILMALSGSVHHVHTAVAASMPGDWRPALFVETAAVRFRPFSRDFAAEYFDLAQTLDRAGAYDIDAYGERLVERVVGSRSCVMGLPALPVGSWLVANGFSAPLVRSFNDSFPA